MTNVCPICSSKVFENTDCFECKQCSKWVHKKCTGLSNDAYMKTVKLIKKEGLKWICKTCEESGVRNKNTRGSSSTGRILNNSKMEFTLADVMEKLENMELKQNDLLQMYNNQLKINQKLRDDIDLLKQKIDELSNTVPYPSENNQLDAIREISERETKKNNLMIFGCEENNSDETDMNNVKNVIKSVCPEINTDDLKVKRIGKKNDEKIRPLKVTLRSHIEVRNLFFKAKELVKVPKYKHLALGFDKTARQIAEYKSLKNEMQERIKNGENNLRIKYFHDVPKIIKISTESKNYKA